MFCNKLYFAILNNIAQLKSEFLKNLNFLKMRIKVSFGIIIEFSPILDV